MNKSLLGYTSSITAIFILGIVAGIGIDRDILEPALASFCFAILFGLVGWYNASR